MVMSAGVVGNALESVMSAAIRHNFGVMDDLALSGERNEAKCRARGVTGAR